MSQYSVVGWKDEHTPQILEVARTALGAEGAVAKTPEFWKWKHQDNPFGRSFGILAVDDATERIASLRVLLRWQFTCGEGRPVLAARAVDTATHPDYQRQGLFLRLTEQAIQGLRDDGTQLIFNTPNEKSMPGYLKLGWTLVDRRPLHLRPLRPFRMARRRVQGAAVGPKPTADTYFDPHEIASWHQFIDRHGMEAWDLLLGWEERRSSCGWRTVRSREYYSWRYGRNPNAQYFVHALTLRGDGGGALVGAAVLRPNVRYGWQEVVLCDVALAEPSPQIGRDLMRSLARSTRADYLIAHFARNSFEHRCLRQSGFVPAVGQGIRFTVRSLGIEPSAITHPDAWDLSLGDLEVF